jgi:hypothetical protein
VGTAREERAFAHPTINLSIVNSRFGSKAAANLRVDAAPQQQPKFHRDEQSYPRRSAPT